MKLKPATVGLLLALASIVVGVLLPKQAARELLSIFLAALGGIYAGLGLSSQTSQRFAIQAVASVAFFLLSLCGLWIDPRFLAWGFIAHAAWDMVHRPGLLNIFVPGWYIPTCLVYDVVLGLWVMLWWHQP